MKVKPPIIDRRSSVDIENTLNGLVPHYTPEWAASDEKDPGVALIKIFSHMTENIIHRLNQAPQKNFVTFLDMLGIKRLPAQPAKVLVTFILAKGLDRGILIPERTQVSSEKTDEHEELAFETESNLMATPSQLVKVLGIDPSRDAIYEIPKKFLDSEPKSQSIISYKIVSSPSKGARNFQMDHITGLEVEDILKIEDSDKIEYVTVSALTATIVKIEEHLEFDHLPNTKVEKVTRFNLFEGKNKQEHLLYLGHEDLFNIKGKAQFNLHVIHRAGTETDVTSLKYSWEYWGEVKEEGAEEGKNEVDGDDWHEFQMVDNTYGFTSSGVIQLNKLNEGEIKEKEIKLKEDNENEKNSIKSRWIRCKLKDKEQLGTDVPRKLPELDKIVFTVESIGKDLSPEIAFNNDTPLDISKTFKPFGKEPRMFDSFAFGSKEIFSKKEANIEIDVKVDPGRSLGAPTAVLYDKELRVFLRGIFGKLYEIQITKENDKLKANWIDHGFPPNTAIATESTPGPVIQPSPSSSSSVFVRGDNGHLIEGFYKRDKDRFEWKDWGSPSDEVYVNSDPAGISDTTISVFVIGSDSYLYEFNKDKGWIDHKRDDNRAFDSSPYAVKYETVEKDRVRVFLKGKDGRLYQLRCRAGDISKDKKHYKWIDIEPLPVGIKVDSRPFAWVSKWACSVLVYVKGNDNHLWEYDKKWNDKGYPDGIFLDSNPHGYIDTIPLQPAGTKKKIHVFIRGKDDSLFEFNDEIGWGTKYQMPVKLRYSPYVLNENEKLHIFSATAQNTILEIFATSQMTGQPWFDHKDPDEVVLTPSLSWEYWNNKGWVVLKDLKDRTSNLLVDGKISFKLPIDIEPTEIGGQKNYWIRARIVGGDYGKETFVVLTDPKVNIASFKDLGTAEQILSSTKNTIRPPLLNKLTISYFLKEEKYPQHCITYNNLEYIVQTDANLIKDKFFRPFVQLEDKLPTIYLGFDKILKSGPLRIFFAAKELSFSQKDKPKMEWAYSLENGWSELKGCSDDTEGLIKSDILEFVGPSDLSARPRFGKYLFWLKGSLIRGRYEKDAYPLLEGIYPNTTWASQEETIRDEILGSSNGLPDQVFALLRLSVLGGEEIRVCEILTEQEIQYIKKNLEEEKLKPIFEKKDETGKVIENWVLWKHVSDFFDSTEKDRHFILDRITGKIQFGNGKTGMIPQAGDNNIKAFSYQTGGGVQGNIKVWEIKSIKSSAPGVDKVFNPTDADGGAEAATLEQILEFGPSMISNRNRAVTTEDFEWLAKKASRKVARVKCLPNRNNIINTDKEHLSETGWVTMIIVPDDKTPRPVPSLELKRKVHRYLEEHCINILTSMQHIWVDGPVYVEISVSADIFVTSIDLISNVERDVREKLDKFFHPLNGGLEGNGWDFGQDVNVSDIYALLGYIEGVDHVEKLWLDYGEPAGKDYLFYWDEIPGSDNERLVEYLVKDLDIDWVRTASIGSSDDLDISRFSWDEFFGKDNEKLIEFLMQNFNVKWIRSVSILKDKEREKIMISDGKNCLSLRLINKRTKLKVTIDDSITEEFIVGKENGGLNIKVRTIKISDGENALFLRLNKEETRVNLIINDGRIDEFNVKSEKGRLKIYSHDTVEIKPNFLVASGKHVINVQFRKEG